MSREYTDAEKADAVTLLIQRMTEGESVRQVGRDLKISDGRLREWAQATPELAAQYARAREAQAEAHADQVLEVASTATPENAQAARLHVDALKWRAAKFYPKVYGERQQVEHSGAVGSYVAEVPPTEPDAATWAAKAKPKR